MSSTRPAPPSRRRRRFGERLRAESWRQAVGVAASSVLASGVVVLLPGASWLSAEDASERFALVLLLFVLVISLYSAIVAGLTHLVLRDLPRPALLASARLSRTRRSSRLLRMLGMTSTTSSESLQMLLCACAMVYVLQVRPPGVPLPQLLGLTVLALVTAWMSCVIGYAVEYAALDAHGDGFRLDGAAEHRERTWHEYLYIAALVQTSSAPADFAPLTRQARRTLLSQSVLAHIMATVVVAVGASAIFSAL